MMRSLLRIFLMPILAAASLFLAAPNSSPAGTQKNPIKIVYLSPSFDISDAWERVYWALQGRLEEKAIRFEIQHIIVSSVTAHKEQLEQVRTVIQTGADYVVLGPTEFEAATPILRKLNRSRIPTVVYNFTQAHADRNARGIQYVGFSHAGGGRISAAWAATRLNGKGKIAIIQGAPGVASDQRRDGFLGVIEQFPHIEVVIGPYTNFDRNLAFKAANRLLVEHRDIELIFGVSTTVGLGAADAVRQAGLTDRVATMGFGGTSEEIAAMREGWLTASVLRPIDDSGVAVADAILQQMNGETPDLIWAGAFIMVDKNSDTDEIVAYANRYSSKKMKQ